MPKAQRRFHTNSKKHKKIPETADDFLAAGIEYEESGDRWRPGDKLKAGRFYQRAIEAYDACLKRNPRSFDASYNMARLEYQLSQQPELLPETERGSRQTGELLETAVNSHLDCLSLQPENEDALFNAAQALVSLAEFLLESRRPEDDVKHQAYLKLTRAIAYLQDCLARQKDQYEQRSGTQNLGENSMEAEDTEPGGVSLHQSLDLPDDDEAMADSPGSEESQYALVIEPVTPSTLTDTLLAILGAYIILLPLAAASEVTSLANTANNLVNTQLLPMIGLIPEREPEIQLTVANFRCSLAEGLFRNNVCLLADWEASLVDAPWPQPPSAESLCANADAHTTLATTVLDSPDLNAETVSWKHLSFASAALGDAAKLEPTKAEIYLARGDTEVLRSNIGGLQAAEKSRPVLRKNAGVYYRGAIKLGDGTVRSEAAVKEMMVRFEDGELTALMAMQADPKRAREVVEDAVAEGIFETEWLDRVSTLGSPS